MSYFSMRLVISIRVIWITEVKTSMERTIQISLQNSLSLNYQFHSKFKFDFKGSQKLSSSDRTFGLWPDVKIQFC